jgi:hypothetical protein
LISFIQFLLSSAPTCCVPVVLGTYIGASHPTPGVPRCGHLHDII